jgi:hypothetical protein
MSDVEQSRWQHLRVTLLWAVSQYCQEARTSIGAGALLSMYQ